MSACPAKKAVLFFGVGSIAVAVNACAAFLWQPSRAQLERIVPEYKNGRGE